MTKKKKTLIIVLSIVAVLAIAIGITLGVLLTRKPEKPPVQEGAIYQTESKIIWSGVAGVAYISFEYVEEPETPEDGQLYGYVFKVMADGSTDVTKCTPWLTGKWELEENNGVYGNLKLTATWDESNSNATKLNGATSGETKTYTLDGDVYKIGVSFSAGADLTFSFNPNNKLNEGGTTPEPSEPCTNHVDNNCDGVCDNTGCDEAVAINHVDEKNNETQAAGADGKCDKCGTNMPSQPSEPTLLLTMNATDATTTMAAELKLYQNNTFDFVLEMMGGRVFGGTWASSDASGQNPMAPLTLTVDSTGSAVVGETITVTITPAQDYSYMTYTCHVDYVVPETITMAFDFTGTFVVSPQPPVSPTVLVTLDATDSTTTMAAQIKMYDNNTFDFELPMMGGRVFGGTWASSDASGQNPMAPLTLTVDSTGSPVVGETITVTITPAQDYSYMTYTCHVDYVVPETITMAFDFTGTFVVNA